MVLLLFATLLVLFTIHVMYLRYYPIKGIPCIEVNDYPEQAPFRLDIRDYNTSEKQKVTGSIVIPIAYLKRYHHEIPAENIHLIASNRMERNLAIRFLRQKGYKVIGYSLTDCGCKDKTETMA